MRLLLVINNLDMGGAEKLISLLAPRFVDRGIDTTVLCLRRTSSALERSLRASGIAVMDTGLEELYSPWQVRRLSRHLAQGRYDVVHVHLFPAQLWTGLASTLNDCPPLVTTEHSTHNRRRTDFLKPLDYLNYSRYSRIICVSDVVAREITRWLPDTASKVVVIPNGIAVSQLRNAQPLDLHEIGVDSRPVIISVGRFVPEKGHESLIRAFAYLGHGTLVLAGDGPTRQDMEALAQSLGLSKRVRFLGIRDDVPRLLKCADVFVQPSRWEGLSLSLLEAMAVGLPVVASTGPGVSETVGDAGLLFEEGNTAALAERLAQVAGSEALRRELGTSVLKRSLDYDIETTADRHVVLYREVASNRVQSRHIRG